jgi:enamine deaminase RidA (YjgF/YER057c/UK114 family)
VIIATMQSDAGGINALIMETSPPVVSIPNVSQAVRAETGKLVFLSGQVPFNPDGKVLDGN